MGLYSLLSTGRTLHLYRVCWNSVNISDDNMKSAKSVSRSFFIIFIMCIVLMPFDSSTTRSRPRAASKGKPSKAPLNRGRNDDAWVNFVSSDVFYETLYIRIDISSEDDTKSVVSIRSTKRWVVILWLWHTSWSWRHCWFSAMSVDDEELAHTPPRRGYSIRRLNETHGSMIHPKESHSFLHLYLQFFCGLFIALLCYFLPENISCIWLCCLGRGIVMKADVTYWIRQVEVTHDHIFVLIGVTILWLSHWPKSSENTCGGFFDDNLTTKIVIS